jgi:hypothetical protein
MICCCVLWYAAVCCAVTCVTRDSIISVVWAAGGVMTDVPRTGTKAKIIRQMTVMALVDVGTVTVLSEYHLQSAVTQVVGQS